MGPLGVQEIIIIFILALVLFGPKKLPELGRMLGRTVSEFRKAKNELKSTWESHMAEIERETQETPSHPEYTEPVDEHASDEYSYSYEDYDRYDGEEPEEGETKTAPVHGSEAAALPAGDHHEVSAPHSSPVHETAARPNGASSASSAPVSAKEEHPAA